MVVGGGHNSLVAAAYLAAAGRSVLLLERLGQVGGAAVSQQVFEGVDVRLSAYSYLVSLLPDRIVADLGLEIRLLDRSVASYTAVRRDGRSRRSCQSWGSRSLPASASGERSGSVSVGARSSASVASRE